MKFALKIAYHGPSFAGFQRQPKEKTVQGELEKALSKLFQQPIELTGAGRTDAGVHGLGQVVAFESDKDRPIEGVLRALNGALKGKISICEAVKLAEDDPFHPRFDALSRTYHYRVLAGCTHADQVLWSQNFWCVGQELDEPRLQKACRIFLGTHDFTTFSSRSDQPQHTRTLKAFEAQLLPAPTGRQYWVFRVQANGFLRKMVRLLVAGVVETGLGRRRNEELAARLQAQNPGKAPHPAPATGLYFHSAEYKNDPFLSKDRAIEFARERGYLGYRFKP